VHCIVTTAGDAAKSLAAVESPWKKYNPEYTFDYNFLDSQFNDLYKSDIHVGQLFNCFAVLTILISCLGLFGLVTFTAESKVKEIGIRKVLGAGIPHRHKPDGFCCRRYNNAACCRYIRRL